MPTPSHTTTQSRFCVYRFWISTFLWLRQNMKKRQWGCWWMWGTPPPPWTSSSSPSTTRTPSSRPCATRISGHRRSCFNWCKMVKRSTCPMSTTDLSQEAPARWRSSTTKRWRRATPLSTSGRLSTQPPMLSTELSTWRKISRRTIPSSLASWKSRSISRSSGRRSKTGG